jgi:hypothetical protein
MVLEIEQKVERKHIEFIIDTLEVWWGQGEHAKMTRRLNAWYETIEHNQGEMQGFKNEIKNYNP